MRSTSDAGIGALAGFHKPLNIRLPLVKVRMAEAILIGKVRIRAELNGQGNGQPNIWYVVI